jgi:hypothetical protein
MKNLNYRLALVVFLGLFLTFSATALSVESVTVTVTLKIEPFQQLILESENRAVNVSKGNDSAVSEVELDDVGKREIELKPAVSAGVKSTLGWKLLAHTENSYVTDSNGRSFSAGPNLDLKIPNPPQSVDTPGSSFGGSWVPISQSRKKIASGGPGFYEPFEIYYRLTFPEANVNNIDGAGVDVVYTMMEL